MKNYRIEISIDGEIKTWTCSNYQFRRRINYLILEKKEIRLIRAWEII